MGNLPPALGLLGIGWYIAACIVLGTLAGLWLDGEADTKPVFTLIGVGLGLFTAGFGGYRMLMGVLRPRKPPE
jgi:hypothetical protein